MADAFLRQAAQLLSETPDEDLQSFLVAVLEERPAAVQALVDWAVPDRAYVRTSIFSKVRFFGTIKSFSGKSGFGFINCDAAKQAHGCDVFLHSDQMGFLPSGTEVSFAILLNKEGKPQAFDLRPEGRSKGLCLGKGADAWGKGADAWGKGADAWGKGADAWGKGADSWGKGADSWGKGAESWGKGAEPWESWGKGAEAWGGPPVAKGCGAASCGKGAESGTDKSAAKGIIVAPPSAEIKASWTPPAPAEPAIDEQQLSLTDGTAQDSASSGLNKSGATLSELLNPTSSSADSQASSAQMVGVTDRRWQGVVKKIKEDAGFGFIACDDLYKIFGVDVFAQQKSQIAQYAVGTVVEFGVFLNKDLKPQAKDITIPPGKPQRSDWKADAPPSAVEMPGITDRRFTGIIKSIFELKGFGFIDCEELRSVFGTDVFVHQKQLNGFAPTHYVTFEVLVNKAGRPQAKNLLLCTEKDLGSKRPRLAPPMLAPP